MILHCHRLTGEVKPEVHHTLSGFVMVAEDEDLFTRETGDELS
jgi:hypothetical protein